MISRSRSSISFLDLSYENATFSKSTTPSGSKLSGALSYTLRFSSGSLEDLDAVWDDVVEASKDYDTADRYIEDYIEIIRIIPQKMDYMKVLFIKNEEDWRRKRED